MELAESFTPASAVSLVGAQTASVARPCSVVQTSHSHPSQSTEGWGIPCLGWSREIKAEPPAKSSATACAQGGLLASLGVSKLLGMTNCTNREQVPPLWSG